MTEESLGTDVEVILGAPPCAESADSVSCCLFLEPNTWNMQGNINTATDSMFFFGAITVPESA